MELDLTTTIALVSAISTILGILIPSFISLIQARFSSKSDQRRIGLEAERQQADQINTAANISLQTSTMMQQALLAQMENVNRLEAEKRRLEDENSRLRLAINELRIIIRTAAADIQELIEDHARLHVEDCTFFDALQSRLQQLIPALSEDANGNP